MEKDSRFPNSDLFELFTQISGRVACDLMIGDVVDSEDIVEGDPFILYVGKTFKMVVAVAQLPEIAALGGFGIELRTRKFSREILRRRNALRKFITPRVERKIKYLEENQSKNEGRNMIELLSKRTGDDYKFSL